MLQTLHIRNLALLEAVELDFSPGFTAVTGETGAGKSILLGGLSLLAGERADKSIVRQARHPAKSPPRSSSSTRRRSMPCSSRSICPSAKRAS